jgi:hypothetical protein
MVSAGIDPVEGDWRLRWLLEGGARRESNLSIRH